MNDNLKVLGGILIVFWLMLLLTISILGLQPTLIKWFLFDSLCIIVLMIYDKFIESLRF